MKIVRTWLHPKVDVEVTWSEMVTLMVLSATHYDGVCKSLSKQGGILYGWNNRFEATVDPETMTDIELLRGTPSWTRMRDKTITVMLNSREADLLAKVAERNPILHSRLSAVFGELVDKYYELNAENLKA
jgi:hypothetical protein